MDKIIIMYLNTEKLHISIRGSSDLKHRHIIFLLKEYFLKDNMSSHL